MRDRRRLTRVAGIGAIGLSALATVGSGTVDHAIARRSQIEERPGLPPYFVENRGQLEPRFAYYVRGRDNSIYFTASGFMVALDRPWDPSFSPAAPSLWTVGIDFVGTGAGVTPIGEGHTDSSEWDTRPTYSTVVYRNLWPGIDVSFAVTAGHVKYTFVVQPGADPDLIRLRYRGTSSVSIAADGALEVTTAVGGFRDERPVAYQEVDGRRVEVTAQHLVHRHGADFDATFKVGPHDRTRALVIDPVILAYCGYIGGAGGEQGWGIAVDPAGAAYVTGYTYSDQASFPVTVGPDLTFNGGNRWGDAFDAKVRADGTGLVYAGYIGGAGEDEGGHGIAVDAAGNAYVAGEAASDQTTFPVTVGPDLTFNGGIDAFVAKIRADGSGLVYAGYIGGASFEWAYGIAVDAAGNAYVAGATGSDQMSFPVTVGPIRTFSGPAGLADAFVAKVRADGTGLDYAGYIGGARDDYGLGIAVDAAGSAYVTGGTLSDESTFPVTVGPALTFHPGSVDAFVAKVRADGTGLAYAGYIGGTGGDVGGGTAVDTAGNAYVTGYTNSDQTTFPVTLGPDLMYNGGSDAFVAKVRADGTGLLYAGYIGGVQPDEGWGIAVDAAGSAYLTGSTNATPSFPVIGGPDLASNGGFDAFVAKVRADGTGLVYCGFIGGAQFDQGLAIAVDSAGSTYVTGSSYSDQTTFPVTVGPGFTLGHLDDAFVAKITEVPCVGRTAEIAGLLAVKPPASPGDVALGWQADPAANGYNVWYVTTKQDIPLANQRNVPPAVPVVGCAVPSPASGNSCTDVGGVGRGAPTIFFYQVHAYCDASSEGP